MKRVVKTLARSLWRISAPLTRPIIRKFDKHMLSLLAAQPVLVQAPSAQIPADLDLVLNSVVRELARLQTQVEILQGQIDELQAQSSDNALLERRLSIVPEAG